MSAFSLQGCLTALVTPFKNGEVDTDALVKLANEQLEAGIAGLVPCGSTGEAATMTDAERKHVIKTVADVAKGKVPVIAGTGTNNTAQSIINSKEALDAGADSVMLVAPFYNKPTQEGMIRHFETICAAVDAPVVLYNVPGRTASAIDPATVAELADIDNIVAIKEASGGLTNTIAILEKRPDFTVLSGEDGLYLPMLAVGAKGLISVASNVMPKKMVAICQAWNEAKLVEAKALFYEMCPVFSAMFYESNPIPVKTALGLMGSIDPELRLPLTPMTQPNLEKLKTVLTQAGVLQ